MQGYRQHEGRGNRYEDGKVSNVPIFSPTDFLHVTPILREWKLPSTKLWSKNRKLGTSQNSEFAETFSSVDPLTEIFVTAKIEMHSERRKRKKIFEIAWEKGTSNEIEKAITEWRKAKREMQKYLANYLRRAPPEMKSRIWISARYETSTTIMIIPAPYHKPFTLALARNIFK